MSAERDARRLVREGLNKRKAGNGAGAEGAFRQALALVPQHPDGLYQLGLLLMQTGRAAEAGPLLARAVAAAPGAIDPMNMLAMTLQIMGRLEQAEGVLNKALSIHPGHPESLNYLGAVHAAQGRMDEAEQNFRQSLQANPKYFDAWLNLAIAMERVQRYDDAETACQRALALRSDVPRAYHILYRVLTATSELEKAAECLKKWARVEPANPQVPMWMGALMSYWGRYEEAGKCFDTALRLAPGNPEVIAGKAEMLERSGDKDGAWNLIEPLIDAGNNDPNLLQVFGAVAAKVDRADEAIRRIEQVLTTDPDGFVRSRLHFMAGDLYDRGKKYDEAFAHYAEGNRLSAAGMQRFDPAAHARWIDRLIAAYGEGVLDHLPRADHGAELPVFIVGMPRSGTSLVEQIIACHPSVYGAGELELVRKMAHSIPDRVGVSEPFPECVAHMTRQVVDDLAGEHLARLTKMGGDASRVVDKLPNNYQYLGLIAQLFPKARVIHCVRNPMDTSLSCFMQQFASLAHTCDLTHLGRYYRDYQRLMDHFEAVLDLPILTVRYEDVVADQEGMSRRIIDFLGLPWDAACLNFHDSERHVITASYDQVQEPIYTRSVERWKHYEAHLGPLIKALEGG
ncbi:MAG: sulfotransferase [Leptospirillia bacterium]